MSLNNGHVFFFWFFGVLQFDDKRADMPLSEEDKLDKDELVSFIKTNSLELIIEFNEEVIN